MSEFCEYEDLGNADCINCFNGLPHLACKYDEEIERKKLRQLVHKRAEKNRKEVYNKAIDDFVNNIDRLCYGFKASQGNLVRIDVLENSIHAEAEYLKGRIEDGN